ncbi:MAG: hypothetical protein SFY69_06295 [Planctomycetota bacterium]|nr:hypothetical protein [Planctomycetota bacterium]
MEDTNTFRQAGVLPLSRREPWPGSLVRRATLATSAMLLKLSAASIDACRGAGLRAGGHMMFPGSAADALGAWHDRQAWPEKPLRVGLVDPGHWATVLAETSGATHVEWYALADGVACDWVREGLDALVTHDADGMLTIETPEHAGREAPWYDWNAPRPLSYPSVFPNRLDAARVTLAEGMSDAAMTRLIIEAAGILARHPARLTLHDRLIGRRPLPATPERSERPVRFYPRADVTTAIVGRMVEELARYRTGSVPTDAERVAARLVSAWAATWSADVDEEFRRLAAEASMRVCADEPETLLRVGAVRLSGMDDEAGLEVLLRAERVVRRREPSITDQVPFLAGELDAGTPGPRTTGRIAAGISLVAATLPDDKLAYFRDDLTDDLRHANALVGRDQDHTLLLSLVRQIIEFRTKVATAAAA